MKKEIEIVNFMQPKELLKRELEKEQEQEKRKQIREEHLRRMIKQKIIALFVIGISIAFALFVKDGTASALLIIFSIGLFLTRADILDTEGWSFYYYKDVETDEVYDKNELQEIFYDTIPRKWGYCFEEWLYDMQQKGELEFYE